MFLNSSIVQDPAINYYGFLDSKEYTNWVKSIEGQTLTTDIYDSPYFGLMPSGAYREMDLIYEAYLTDKGISIQSKTTSPGINPALLLAAAAFFFAG